MKKKQCLKIYNLFPKLVGSVENWYQHIDRIQDMGFNSVFINPVYYPGFSGSIYAPKDYYKLNPDFFSASDRKSEWKLFEQFIDYCHKKDILVILDLVINHSSIDSVLVTHHPKWYQYDDNGELLNPGVQSGDEYIKWGDLAEFNYHDTNSKNELIKYWKELLDFLGKQGVDGYRCDAAYMLPSDVWVELINYSKDKYNNIFMAESLGCAFEEVIKLAESGFDYLFNSSKYWNMGDDWCIRQYMQTREYAFSISFAESHDTVRLASEYNENINGIRQRIIFSGIFSSSWMLPVGCEYGFRKKLDVAKTNPNDWEPIRYDITYIIKRINELKDKYQVFSEESEIIQIDNSNSYSVLSFLKVSNDNKQKALVIINKDVHNEQYFEMYNIYNHFNGNQNLTDISILDKNKSIPNDLKQSLLPGQIKIILS